MLRLLGVVGATLAVTFAGAGAAVADTDSNDAKKAPEKVKCPIVNKLVDKSKAIKVKTKGGKTVYVCCKGCVAAAKQLE